MPDDPRALPPEVFDFVVNNELKRAIRSQNFLTLLVVDPTPRTAEGQRPQLARELARVIGRVVRETDILSPEVDGRLSLVLLDADFDSSMHVVDRLMTWVEHYEFRTPATFSIGAASLPDAWGRPRHHFDRRPSPTGPIAPRTTRQFERSMRMTDMKPTLMLSVLVAMLSRAGVRPGSAAVGRGFKPVERRFARGFGRTPDGRDECDRLQAGRGRQAAGRGLSRSADVADAADSTRRQDHACRSSATWSRRERRRRRLRDILATSLKEYITNPVVTVIVVEAHAANDLRDRRGQRSRNPSDQGKTTVIEALAMAGGFKDFANTKNIIIQRTTPTGVKRIKFNYKDAIRSERQTDVRRTRRRDHRAVVRAHDEYG